MGFSIEKNMLKYGIIGCGAAAKVHLFHLLREHPEVQITAICDPVAPKDELFTSVAVPHYNDYKEMLKQEQLDAVSIVSPHYLHYQQALACAEKNIHVLCEKPLALEYAQACEVVERFQEHNLVLTAMLPRRFFNNTLALQKVIADERLGKIESINYTLNVHKKDDYYLGWRGQKNLVGGGVLMCQALHDLDRLTYLFGQPQIVSAQLQTHHKNITVEDWAEVQLLFPNNIPAFIHADTISEDTWKGIIEIQGTKGRVVLNSEATDVWEVSEIEKPAVNEDRYDPLVKPRYYGPSHGEVIDDFVQSILKKKEPFITAASTLPTLKLLEEIYGWKNKYLSNS